MAEGDRDGRREKRREERKRREVKEDAQMVELCGKNAKHAKNEE